MDSPCDPIWVKIQPVIHKTIMAGRRTKVIIFFQIGVLRAFTFRGIRSSPLSLNRLPSIRYCVLIQHNIHVVVYSVFSDEDLGVIFEDREDEFFDRLKTVCLRKNFYGGGFMGYYGMHWTRSAFHKQFVRPLFEPVLEHFDGLTQETDARKVLDKLLEEHDNLLLIHDSLIDLLENLYPAKPVMKLIGEIFFLLHEDEKLSNCWHHRCDWHYKQKESLKSN